MSYSNSSLIPSFNRRPSKVAIRSVASYEADVEAMLWETLQEFQLSIRDKTVLIKPNFVEPDAQGLINTHPVVIRAAREAFLRMGAKSVTVAEGPANERDTEGITEVLRLRDYLGPLEHTFVDLNTDEVSEVPTRTRASKLKALCLPKSVLGADKNVLHWAGISRSILDINSTVRPDFAIVDGILGMEGNGPIQGTPKASGVLVSGDDPVAVDATCARIMGLAPERIDYLKQASLLLGNLQEERIEQRGESISGVRTPFKVLPAFENLRG
ncbi:MAG: DUF362 domain-containing protein [Acidobacteriota bacterium]